MKSQVYRSPPKKEAHDLFIEEKQDHYNESTKQLIDLLYNTIESGIADSIETQRLVLCISLVFTIYPETLYESYINKTETNSTRKSVMQTIRSLVDKDIDSINKKLVESGKSPVDISETDLEAVHQYAIDYTLQTAVSIYNYFGEVEKFNWRKIGLPDPRLSYEEQLKHIGCGQEEGTARRK